MALPSGYTELEYIKSSGTQYIDTNFVPDNNTRVVMDVSTTSESTAAFFGCRVATRQSAFIFWKMAATSYRMDYNNSNETIDLTAPTRFIVDMNKNVLTFAGQTVTAPTSTFAVIGNNLMLLTQTTGGAVDTRKLPAQIYACQIYDNGQLIRDFVPCKNPSGEVGLYDQAYAHFYGNAGTGVFEAGPEIIPDYGVVALQDAQLTIGTSATTSLDLVVIDPASGAPLNVTVNSVSGTVNDTATTWTLSGGLWTATAPLSEMGQYLCVFDVATSDGKTVEMRLPLYYGVISLITDRTQADVDELLSILQTPFADWTTEQAQLFYSGMSKGAYNASDLNRVGAAMVYIAERMASMGYAVDNIAPKLYWMDTDVVTQSDMGAYLSDLAALRAVLELPSETPAIPTDMAELTFTEANDIEQILTIINTMLTNITLAYMYAGELYGGEV